MGVLHIVLETATEAVVTEAIIECDVGLSSRLPPEVGIGVVDRDETDDGLIPKHVTGIGIGR